jgi:hypothetical protein
MSTQDFRPTAARGSSGHQPPDDASPISSISEDEHATERHDPLIHEPAPMNLGPVEHIPPIAALPTVPNGRSSLAASVPQEPAPNMQLSDQDLEFAEEDQHQPRLEARGEGGYNYTGSL